LRYKNRKWRSTLSTDDTRSRSLNTATFVETQEVVDRLAQLGLSADALREAVEMGEAARNSCTANDPAITPGFLAWARTTRGLRELLAPEDWRRSNEGGLETTVAPDGNLALAVATGDDSTGRAGASPKTKYSKGPATVAAVEQNQLSLFESLEPIVPGPAPTDRVTWLLLIARGGREVRCELSLPAAIGDDGRVEVWAERIILEPVSRDPEPTVNPVDQEPEIVVEVSRRAI
jgi:hypothetical protein